MLKKNKNLVLDVDEERRTALHWACHLDYVNMSQVLIDFGAQVNARDDFGRKPIDEVAAVG
jgi:ankyrin repeat protein